MWNFSAIDNFGSVWSLLIQISLVLIFLFLGNVLSKSIPFLRKLHIPSALLGGLLLLICDYVLSIFFDSFGLVDKQIMQVITYHALAIGFIAMTLKNKDKNLTKKPAGVIRNGLITGGTYMLQAFVGIGSILLFIVISKSNLFKDVGILLPLAFGQGPGNAMTWDVNFTSEGLLESNGSLGLTLASIGFIISAVVGVAYINVFRKKGLIASDKAKIERKVEEFVSDEDIDDNDSIDKFSIQIALVALSYALAYILMYVLSFTDFTNSIVWGFNFIFGILTATLVKLFVNLFRNKNISKHNYINNYQMERISGFSFDLMIIAGVAAIEIKNVKAFIPVIIILTLVGTIVSYIYVRIMTKLTFKGNEHAMFLVNFGTLTGTASNGMILLREVDPTFSTRAADIFALSQFPAMIAVAPLLLLLEFSAAKPIIAMFIFFGLFLIYTLIIIFLNVLSSKKNK